MDNQMQQAVEYIRQQISQGVPETEIRTRLLSHGWPLAAVDQAFQHYYEPMGATTLQAAAQTNGNPQKNKADKSGPSKKKVWLIVGGIAALVAAGLLAIVLLSPMMAEPALNRNAENTARRNDVARLSAATAEFIDANNGLVPQSVVAGDKENILKLCGENCEQGSVTAKLDYYKNSPSAIHFKAYSEQLRVPDTQTVYIVTDALCNEDQTGLGRKITIGSGLSAAFLYALDSSSGPQQQCLQL